MAEIHGRLGRLYACHVIQREGPQPYPGMSGPAPARLRPPGGRSRPAHGRLPIPGPSRPGRHPLPRPTTGPFVHADLKRE
jgi:hypothetical protein